MTYLEKIMQFVHRNNGVITSSKVTELGINRQHLKILVERGMLERAERGVYILPSVFEDELFNLQSRYKKGVFSHETALFLLDLTDRTPNQYVMTFPANYNSPILQSKQVRTYRVTEEYYGVGITKRRTPAGQEVYLYNAERTLCDILRGHSGTDIQLVTEAFKRYVQTKDRNIQRLSEYAERFRVAQKVRTYLEVLL